MKENNIDAIVIGSGLAGVSAALSIDQDLKVLLVTKDKLHKSNSYLAQGGIAIAFGEDSSQHMIDTLTAGHHKNDQRVVSEIIQASQNVFSTLEQWGVLFDRQSDGQLMATKEGGHSIRRVLHIADQTGKGIMDPLLERLKRRDNIIIKTNTMIKDLIVSNQRIAGVIDQENVIYNSPNVILATGGIGHVFEKTTNDSSITADGIAMALRSNVSIEDIHLIQFHPTCLKNSSNLITEALRGEGARIVTDENFRVMAGVHPFEDLAPRDIVVKEMNKYSEDGRNLYLDARNISKEQWLNRFPFVHKVCMENGINPEKALIPIEAVEHFSMGGIKVDEHGQTSLAGLYAVGEVACSGFHGLNRMASNSLLECVYFGTKVGKSIKHGRRNIALDHNIKEMGNHDNIETIYKRLQNLLINEVIDPEELNMIRSKMNDISPTTRLMLEMYNMSIVALEILEERNM